MDQSPSLYADSRSAGKKMYNLVRNRKFITVFTAARHSKYTEPTESSQRFISLTPTSIFQLYKEKTDIHAGVTFAKILFCRSPRYMIVQPFTEGGGEHAVG
jgi:hypothetical protein